MSTQHVVAPSPKQAAGIEEIKNLILTRFPEATFDVRPAPSPGTWSLLVVLADEDKHYDEFADLVYSRVADLRFDRGVKIEVTSADSAQHEALIDYVNADRDLSELARSSSTPVDMDVLRRLQRKRDEARKRFESISPSIRTGRGSIKARRTN